MSPIQASRSVLEGADREPTPQLQAELLQHFKWYASTHERDGNPIPSRLLNGTAMNQADFTPNRALLANSDFIRLCHERAGGQCASRPGGMEAPKGTSE